MRAYMIFQERFHDRELFEDYRRQVLTTLEPHHGRFLVRGGDCTILEGGWPYERTVILEFPSRPQAEAWYNSNAYQAILPIRLRSLDSNAVLVDGVD
jgi:uncharacterized protein (DUF1330 family)